MLAAVREQGLEGVVAKGKTSIYDEGKRTGSWTKMRINEGQEFVVGGFMQGPHGVDSIIVGYYRGKDLYYVGRVRNGFVPATRRVVYAFATLSPWRSATTRTCGRWSKRLRVRL